MTLRSAGDPMDELTRQVGQDIQDRWDDLLAASLGGVPIAQRTTEDLEQFMAASADSPEVKAMEAEYEATAPLLEVRAGLATTMERMPLIVEMATMKPTDEYQDVVRELANHWIETVGEDLIRLQRGRVERELGRRRREGGSEIRSE